MSRILAALRGLLPSALTVQQFLTLTVLPLFGGIGASLLLVHVPLLGLLNISHATLESTIYEAGSFLIGTVVTYLASHHILRGTYEDDTPKFLSSEVSVGRAASPIRSSAKRVYGWRRSLPGLAYPDADTSGLKVLKEVDPRDKMPPIFNQLTLGACTANATGAAFQYDSIQDGRDCGELSRLWIYYFERSIEHTLEQGDCGAMGHDAFTVAKHGIPDETLWPYDIAKFEDRPPAGEPRAYTLTKDVRTVPQTEEAIKQVLSNGQTIAFGFTVYSSFESAHVAASGIVAMPAKGESVLGGHEVLCIGYLKAHPEYVLCRNSWGEDWGLAGYFLMPTAYITDPSLAGDLRTIVRPTS